MPVLNTVKVLTRPNGGGPDVFSELPDQQTATTTPATAPTGLTGTNTQALINDIASQLVTLIGLGAKNIIGGVIDPVAADGDDGDGFINYASGDIFGPKAGGAWPASTSNAYSQLGLTNTAALAAGVAASGSATVAARADHVHPLQPAQNAADTAVTPAGNLASANVQAALVELQADIDTLAAGGGAAVGNAIPQALGTASAGTAIVSSREDHVHASELDAIPDGTKITYA